jgi:hypothetical protein
MQNIGNSCVKNVSMLFRILCKILGTLVFKMLACFLTIVFHFFTKDVKYNSTMDSRKIG